MKKINNDKIEIKSTFKIPESTKEVKNTMNKDKPSTGVKLNNNVLHAIPNNLINNNNNHFIPNINNNSKSSLQKHENIGINSQFKNEGGFAMNSNLGNLNRPTTRKSPDRPTESRMTQRVPLSTNKVNNIVNIRENFKAKEEYYEEKSKDSEEDEVSEIFLNYNQNLPQPNLNFEKLAVINSARPQTSYGGISERKRSLQKNLRQQSSKMFDRNIQFGMPMTQNQLVNKLSELMKDNA